MQRREDSVEDHPSSGNRKRDAAPRIKELTIKDVLGKGDSAVINVERFKAFLQELRVDMMRGPLAEYRNQQLDVGPTYIEDIFNQDIVIKFPHEEIEWNGPDQLFQEPSWSVDTIVEAWNSNSSLRSALSRVYSSFHGFSRLYKSFETFANIGGFINSQLKVVLDRNLNHQHLGYSFLVELLIRMEIQIPKVGPVVLVSIGDFPLIIKDVLNDFVRDPARLSVHSILAKDINGGDVRYKCNNNYTFLQEDMAKFHQDIKKNFIQQFGEGASFPGVNIMYLRMDFVTSDVYEKQFEHQRMFMSAIVFATLTMAEGGSLVVYSTQLGMGDHYIFTMYVLSVLFEDVRVIRPVAGFDCHLQVFHVAKGFKKGILQPHVYDVLMRGNETSCGLQFPSNVSPIPRDMVPAIIMQRAVDASLARLIWYERHNKKNLLLFLNIFSPKVEALLNRVKIETAIRWMKDFQVVDVVHPVKNENEENGAVQVAGNPGVEANN